MEVEEPKETRTRGSATGTAAPANKPNVFFIMIDDMGWGDIGYQSTDLVGVTPNMDKLAAGGVKVKKSLLRNRYFRYCKGKPRFWEYHTLPRVSSR